METLIGKLQQVEGVSLEKGDGGASRNDANAGDDMHNISLDLLRKQFHMSLDINQPAQIHDQSCFSAGYEINFEIEPASKETKKRSMVDTKMSDYENSLGLDLKLKLSPPGSSSENLSNALKSTTPWISLSSSSSSQGTCISSHLNSNENPGGTSNDELPPLIVMGCTRCHIYVMVSKADPKCPNCNNHVLLDKFRENPAKKLRKSRI